MGNVKFKLNLPGLNELMKSAPMQDALMNAGQAVANQASGATAGYTLRWIGVCNIFPDSAESAHDNFKNNTLMKALGAVGLKMSK